MGWWVLAGLAAWLAPAAGFAIRFLIEEARQEDGDSAARCIVAGLLWPLVVPVLVFERLAEALRGVK